MEPLAPSKRLIVIASAVVLTTAAGYLTYRYVTSQSLSRLARSDLPMLDVSIQLIDNKGKGR